ncbi:EAL domain-containing protein [Alteromonas sp. BL110]|uniref:EAL domain-containing protein n=1 Tax=Alteromonas sp. BL110 TaxID=1714845 RepID=UPI000E4ABFE3|nr:EAL domain-containing protein [Alteromonas sp. BL110]AXT37277.1 EAL domain-containing protein [Alteromonas sp. BL110]RKM80015.1 EAL domain-containing protein [Alteromonas sp. BL110]
MKLSSQTNLGIVALLFLAFTALSVVELRELQSNASEAVMLQAEKSALVYKQAVVQQVPLSPQAERLALETLLESAAAQPLVSAALVIDPDGKEILSAKAVSENTAPSWYSHLDPSPAFVKRVALYNSENNLVLTTSKSTLANGFFTVLVKNIAAFLVLAVLLSLFVVLVNRRIKRPVDDTVKKLNEIGSHNFTSPEITASSEDFKPLTEAANSLAGTLSTKFDELKRQSELFKKEASKDSLTMLANRSAFERHMRALLNDNASAQEKELIIVRLAHLGSINTKMGMVPGDNYIKAVANILVEETKNNHNIRFVFRLSGGDFALISEAMESAARELMLTNLAKQCASASPLRDGTKATFMGITRFVGTMTMPQIMESVDSALITAMKTQNGWQLASEISKVHSNTQWRERLNYIVSQQYADIMIQPVMNTDQNVPAYYEASGRFKDKDTNDVIPMAQLIPASERLDLIPQVDKLVTTIVLKKLEVTSQHVAVNLSIASIANAEFRDWLVKEVAKRKTLSHRLNFEVEDAALIQYREVTESLCRQLINIGCGITIERFGDNFASLSGLRAIQPQFVKLSGRLTQGIHTNKDNQLFISSLVSIAKGLNVKVIAEMVENEAESVALNKLGVDHQQGYYFAKPALWNVY